MTKTATKFDILCEAKDLFFPKGKSTFGHIDKFEADLAMNVQGTNLLQENITIGELYEKTKHRYIRFYLLTNRKSTHCQVGTVCKQGTSSNDDNQCVSKSSSDNVTKSDIRDLPSYKACSKTRSTRLKLKMNKNVTSESSTNDMVMQQHEPVQTNTELEFLNLASPQYPSPLKKKTLLN